MEGFLRIFYLVKKPCVQIQKFHESISWLYRAENAVSVLAELAVAILLINSLKQALLA